MAKLAFPNPFRPGAGHMPPHLAGRGKETGDFHKLLRQNIILQNMVLTGLRGVGKTVLLDTLKPLAQEANWLWAGTDLSESTSVSEDKIVLRLITDLAVVCSGFVYSEKAQPMGFDRKEKIVGKPLNFTFLCTVYDKTPGLPADKLKAMLELVWNCMKGRNVKGIVFAYDEAQTMSDSPKKEQYPLSLLLEQSNAKPIHMHLPVCLERHDATFSH